MHWGRMGLFAAMLTYLVSAALLVGGMVTAAALFFAKPSDSAMAQKPRPPLVRAAERQAAEALKVAPASPQSTAAAPSVSAVNRPPPVPPQLKAAEQTKKLTGESARKKKVAKPATPTTSPPRDDNNATLGYSPSEQPRKFVFPLDPDW
jgi:hypothetical protein